MILTSQLNLRPSRLQLPPHFRMTLSSPRTDHLFPTIQNSNQNEGPCFIRGAQTHLDIILVYLHAFNHRSYLNHVLTHQSMNFLALLRRCEPIHYRCTPNYAE